MQYAETVVNVPIRRTFSRQYTEPPPPLFDEPDAFPGGLDAGLNIGPNAEPTSAPARVDRAQRGLQTFHYHIPPSLESEVRPGHLVWAPFGKQEVQGVVVRITGSAPVATKPLLRLARPQPVLTPVQLELAAWITDYYIAPFSEAVKLFLPPGMLTKADAEPSRGARAKREVQVELLAQETPILHLLLRLGRESQQAAVLQWLLDHPNQRPTRSELQQHCGLKSPSAINTLCAKELLRLCAGEDGIERIALVHSPAETRRALIEVRGADKFEPILRHLQAEGRALWKSELYEHVSATLADLRTLQAAGVVQLTEKVRFRDPLGGRTYPRTSPHSLTEDQARVWQTIVERGLDRLVPHKLEPRQAESQSGENGAHGGVHPPHPGECSKFLLHGVTGSGKTEIYLRAIDRALQMGRQAIVLVPEIALTPQTVARFAGRFPDRVTVIHSNLSNGERYDVWRHIRDGDFDVVVGPRSALFAPMPRLGLIIVDEEHESSYKQSAEAWGSFTVFYDARLIAHRMAELTGSVLIFGSATPSLESYCRTVPDAAAPTALAHNGAVETADRAQTDLTLLEMPRRVLGHTWIEGRNGNDDGTPGHYETTYAELPPVEIVDMRQELRAGNRSIFSRTLHTHLQATLDAGEQAILFLNRRGTHTFVICRDCGHVQECSRCEVPLTYHERASVLVCHHCNAREPIPTICPECGKNRIKYFGSGTQHIEELVREVVPDARIVRWDADTTGRKGAHEALLERFAKHEADVMVGTQMIAKGLDLPMVTLVGVIAADTGLHLPDFRSSERTFQLLTQVAGRAGRSRRGGRVILQTYSPEHYAVQAAAGHDYRAFFEREIEFRREHGYPPAQPMVRLIYWDKNLEKTQKAADAMAAALQHRLSEMGEWGELHNLIGPAPAPFARFRNYYRWQIMVRGPRPTDVVRGVTIPFGWRIDVDPVSTL